ncbi:MAG TPA: TIGR03086 family metal-binding protein [Actinomycetes bacterium]
MTTTLDLSPAATEVARLLHGVRDDHLAGPTPCPDYSVAALLDHLMGLSMAFTWAATKTTPPAESGEAGPPDPSAEHLDAGWRRELPERLRALAAAWKDPDAWTGMATAGGVTMPAEVMGAVALDEVVLHGWDLARATGQELVLDPASTHAVLAFTETSARPENEAGRAGVFGPVVPVPADAPPLDRALGYAGRDPSWAPPTP